MEADPAWITICNRLMRKFDQEMSGEMRKNYYASATQFYFSGDCAEASKPRFLLVARAGIEPATHGFSVNHTELNHLIIHRLLRKFPMISGFKGILNSFKSCLSPHNLDFECA